MTDFYATARSMGLFSLGKRRRSSREPPHLSPTEYQQLLQDTKHYWRTWLSQCRYQGRWREMVQRSALALKFLTYAPTGAIVAAPTTSLPESMGGERNWDYRYTWLRDSSLTIHSLLLSASTRRPGVCGLAAGGGC